MSVQELEQLTQDVLTVGIIVLLGACVVGMVAAMVIVLV